MNTICCLDLEGVLIPEIWIKVSEKTRIKALNLTTRDVPDYDLLMSGRLKILKEHKITLQDIQSVIAKIEPLPGAKKFLEHLRSKTQVVILSDTYYEFASSLMKKLGHPTLFCNWLDIDDRGYIRGYCLRQQNGKQKAVAGIRELGFRVAAAGDSYNDLTMLRAADVGVLYRPPDKIIKDFPQFKVTQTYQELQKALLS